jgi:hypothetical protein
VGKGPSSLGVFPTWPCGGLFTVSRRSSLGSRGCIETQMQDGVVATKCLSGRMGSVNRSPPGTIPSWVQVYTLCRVLIYTYSRILGHRHALDSSVLMFWDFYLPQIVF